MLEGDALKDIGDIFAAVGVALQGLVDFAPFNYLRHVGGVIKELGDGRAEDPVLHILQPVDFHAMLHYLFEPGALAQQGHRFFQPGDALDNDTAQVFGALGGALLLIDLVDEYGVRRRVNKVNDIVQAVGQMRDILAVKRSDEGAVQLLHNLVGDGIAAMLQPRYLRHPDLHHIPALQHLLQYPGGLDEITGAVFKQAEEILLAGQQ